MREASETSLPRNEQSETLQALLAGHEAWLSEHGHVTVGSGYFTGGDGVYGCLHTEYGPAGQDKAPENQDYALAWCPRPKERSCSLQLAVAIADGLTSSFRSDWASALACWAAVRALVAIHVEQEDVLLDRKTIAISAFDAAGKAVGELADDLRRDSRTSCPPGQFVSTWDYILKKGLLLQTTLTLAWLDRGALAVAIVGDGGVLLRQYSTLTLCAEAIDEVLARCDLETQQVHALGPANRSITVFDAWIRRERSLDEHSLRQSFLCALHTDGIGRGLRENVAQLLDDLDADRDSKTMHNPAERCIARYIAERPADFSDNLTVVAFRRG